MEREQLEAIFEAVMVLPLRASDVVVFRTVEHLKIGEHLALYERLEQRLGTSRILIVEGGADLAIIRPEGEAEPAPEPEAAPVLDAVARHNLRKLS